MNRFEKAVLLVRSNNVTPSLNKNVSVKCGSYQLSSKFELTLWHFMPLRVMMVGPLCF